MQTRLPAALLATVTGQRADSILRSCVHCGFCTATCPTYLVTGDERDSPRGRIYLIKALLEGESVTARTQHHLDRCLTCRACETTCPSGVAYNQLLDIGRDQIEQLVGRSLWSIWKRRLLRWWLPHPTRLAPLLRGLRLLVPLLPQTLRQQLPPPQRPLAPPVQLAKINATYLLLEGCVQSLTTPNTNAALRTLLALRGIQLKTVVQSGCCGAISHHLDAPAEALTFMRRNIDAWWPHLQQGAQGIIASASGCGAELKRYGELLQDDPVYAERAAALAQRVKDPCEVIQPDWFRRTVTAAPPPVAFQSPCTLQHGQRLLGKVEAILQAAGYRLTMVKDAHLCCGSAGTYSLLQPQLSKQLRVAKLEALMASDPSCIATANVGCQLHLAQTSPIPVRHWLELLAEAVLANPTDFGIMPQDHA
ncbi:MAG TPA: glycolate oxidase subunit GlcF [Motiliproteus sp.]